MTEFDQLAAPDYPVFLGAGQKHPAPADAFFHVLPIPFEGGQPSSGAGMGPKAILEASWRLTTWDGRSEPVKMGIHTHPPVDVKGEPEQVMANISAAAGKILSLKKFPVCLGGEHAVTYGVVKALTDAGYEEFGVVQIDAQANLLDEVDGNPFAQGTVMKRIVDEDIAVFQLGVRSLSKSEVEARKVNGVKYYDADFLVNRNISKIELPVEFPDKVYISVDVDGLDPSVFPATGLPVPGGLGWYQTLSLIDSVVNQAEVIGMELTGLSPIDGFTAYQHSAAMLVYKMMGIIQRSLNGA